MDDNTYQPDQRQSKAAGFAIVGASLLGALVVAGGLYWWQGRSETATETSPDLTSEAAGTGEESIPAETSTPAEPDPGDTGPSPTTTKAPSDDEESTPEAMDHAVCPDGTPVEVCSAAEFVETARGRSFKVFPTVELVDPDEFERRLLADFETYSDDLRADEATMVALGLIEPDADLVDIFRESLSVGVVGFYDPETGELVIKGGDLDLYAELVIVHELTHAFDDQWFDLDRPEVDDLPDDPAFGFSAVVEGNASRVEDAWRSSLSESDESALTALEFGLLSPADIERYLAIPAVVLELQISPYTLGEDFVSEVASAEGEGGVDALLENPPESSEQILHPDRYFSDEGWDDVVSPEAAGQVLDEGSLGELVIRVWLGPEAADGWNGDSYVTWDAGEGERCVAAALAADSGIDTDELESSLSRWAEEQVGRQMSRDGDRLEILGCN